VESFIAAPTVTTATGASMHPVEPMIRVPGHSEVADDAATDGSGFA
jgi:hypothetical protein